MPDKSQRQVVADARKMLEADDRIEAVKALTAASNDLDKKRAELAETERQVADQQRVYRDAYDRAKKASWTAKQLKDLGFNSPPRAPRSATNETAAASSSASPQTSQSISDDSTQQQQGDNAAWPEATGGSNSSTRSGSSATE